MLKTIDEIELLKFVIKGRVYLIYNLVSIYQLLYYTLLYFYARQNFNGISTPSSPFKILRISVIYSGASFRRTFHYTFGHHKSGDFFISRFIAITRAIEITRTKRRGPFENEFPPNTRTHVQIRTYRVVVSCLFFAEDFTLST